MAIAIRKVAGNQRPRLSVMITVYNRTEYLARAIQSVTSQLHTDEVQIEVVSDAEDAQIKKEIAAVISSCNNPRVSLYQTEKNVGHPEIFNLCIHRARGYWVHILHDDDWVKPGFYAVLEKGFDAPDVGLVFCRREHLDSNGTVTWTSWEEREAPGIIPDWIDRIFTMSRIQFSSVIVRREVYEKAGGFSPRAASAFDWEMWKRASIQFNAWFDPAILAVCTKNGDAETDKLLQTGQQIADSRLCIEVTRDLLPAAVSEPLFRQAMENCALYALYVARQQVMKGREAWALTNLREGLKCDPSEEVRLGIMQLINQIGSSNE